MRVGRCDQLGDDVVALRDRIVSVAASKKEIRCRYLVAPVPRHRNHVEAVAVAGQVHHFQLRGGERFGKTLTAGERDRVHELLRLQERPDIDVQIQRVNAKPLSRPRQRLMPVPVVGNALGESYHLAQDRNLALLHRLFGVGQSRGAREQILDELIAAFGDNLDGIRGQQLVVAERRGDRAGGLVVFEPGLNVVFAVAPGLEAINADNLPLRQAGCQRDLGIGAFELAFALGPPGNEFEFLLRGRRKSATTGTAAAGGVSSGGLEGSRGFGGPV